MRQKLANLTAVGMLSSGTLLAYLAFFAPPVGSIDDSIIYIYAQCLVYAGSIFGVGTYINTRFNQLSKKIKHEENK